MRTITYYRVDYDGLNGRPHTLTHKCFESMDDAIRYLEDRCRDTLVSILESREIVNEWIDRWDLGYTHQVVLKDKRGYAETITIRVDMKHLTLE